MKRRLDDAELARLKRAYEEKMVGTHEICRRFLIRRDDLTALARQHGWAMRRPTIDGRVVKLREALQYLETKASVAIGLHGPDPILSSACNKARAVLAETEERA